MATATEPQLPGRSIAPGIVLAGTSWANYEAMLQVIGDRRIYVNYDSKVMEVLVPSFLHEDIKDCLRLIVDIVSEESALEMRAGGSTTLRRADLEKGVEPDECYWFADAANRLIRHEQLDLSVDPPPDLVIEVNFTSSSVNRMAIYASLGVNEVWRFDGEIQFYARTPAGTYNRISQSLYLSGVTETLVNRQLDAYRSQGRLEWMRSFRKSIQ